MQNLKTKIANSIQMPIFLIELRSEHRDEVIDIVYKILDSHYKGVTDEFLNASATNRLLYKIEWQTIRLKEIVTPETHLNCWMWIGDTVNKWIEYSLQEEAYEVATNLRKIINFEYE